MSIIPYSIHLPCSHKHWAPCQWIHCCYYLHHLNEIKNTPNHWIFLQTRRHGPAIAIMNIVLHSDHVVTLWSPDVHQHFKPSRRCHTAGLLKGADKIICRLHLNYPGDLRDDAAAISPSAPASITGLSGGHQTEGVVCVASPAPEENPKIHRSLVLLLCFVSHQ